MVQVAVQVGSVFGLTATNFDGGGEAERHRLKGDSAEKLNHSEPNLNQEGTLRRWT
jgi:hypothetical protein